MSWSVSTKASMTEDVSAALDKAFETAPQALEHAGPQADYAKQAVLSLLTGVARDTDDVFISMSGHYNPDKEPVAGWADCQISITVSQSIPKPSE